MLFKAIKQSTASQMVVEQILDSLKTREFKPGEKLPSQMDLAKMFNVGRSSIREAIKSLDALGYLEVSQGKGTFFKNDIMSDKPSMSELKYALETATLLDLMRIRMVLECYAAELAADSANPKHIQQLEEAIKGIQDSEDDRKNFIEADLRFHHALAQTTDNMVLCEILKLFLEKVHRHYLIYYAISSETRKRTIETANQILSCILKSDTKKASACMRDHLDAIMDELKNVAPEGKVK
jgi:GntR family transcriptional repressor for pyruvate dehydrogenase complex